jgi:hypothetical protein
MTDGVVVEIGEHRRLDEPAAIEPFRPRPARGHSALLQPLGDVALNAVALPARDQRAYLRLGIKRVTNGQRSREIGYRVDDLVISAPRRQHAGAEPADLSIV